ncbi:hypothetical protein M407DRAFT_240649 [Tulasnella calospora MUT 4182]|uniref:Nascent polypeptide-associated complex subunit alpha-like UBA domain-containing protein n=1 Tax=Tulasnella calospora MUT 4182 TaxID=1051891 RepID=A0A0C3MKU9_9AGAM|nr:hypothetical protein M407DRAFT_240649 [Tulasnella calospora MUT 4182]
MAGRVNGRPEPEVIAQFQDGLSYSKGKLEQALTAVLANKPQPTKDVAKCKKEDVDIIVDEFEIPRARAEKILAAHDGNVEAALYALVERTA